jgi:hypothetical protein
VSIGPARPGDTVRFGLRGLIRCLLDASVLATRDNPRLPGRVDALVDENLPADVVVDRWVVALFAEPREIGATELFADQGLCACFTALAAAAACEQEADAEKEEKSLRHPGDRMVSSLARRPESRTELGEADPAEDLPQTGEMHERPSKRLVRRVQRWIASPCPC